MDFSPFSRSPPFYIISFSRYSSIKASFFFFFFFEEPVMGGVIQTIKFLSAAVGVGISLKGLDWLAQRVDE